MKLRFPEGDTHFCSRDWEVYQVGQYKEAVRRSHRGTALDCGAHCGIMTRRMSEDFDRVIAFEPVWWELLAENTRDRENVTIIDAAVGAEALLVGMVLNPTNTGDNHVAGEGTIQMITIDSLGLTEVDFIKMDIQGSEYSALLGARETIQTHRPVLMTEIEPDDPNGSKTRKLLMDWEYVPVHRRSADVVWQYKG